ncbi:MAG: hypothetical protein HONBIEJF_01242 [Fimbriimonadaceae bacterium]|nr:hypothetical protein [Fimbriimonadaceae bacterium]
MGLIALIALMISAPGGRSPLQNGLADLEAACAIIASPRFASDYRAFLRALDDQGLALRRGVALTPQMRTKRARLIGPFVKKHGIICQHAARAVSKPIQYPRNWTGGFSFPQFAKLKEVARFLAFDAEAQIVARQSGQAAQRILVAMKLATSLQGAEVIREMVGIGIWSQALATLDLFKDDLHGHDWPPLADYSEKCLKLPPPIARVIEHQIVEIPTTTSTMKPYREGLDFLTTYDPADNRERPAPQAVKQLTEKRATEIVELGASRARRNFRRQLEWLRAPEATWWPAFTRYPQEDLDLLKAETEDDLVTGVQSLLGSDNRQMLRNTMLLRTQQRLVVLHARVRSYRAAKGRYPESLSNLVGKQVAFDPFANKPFHYRSLPKDSFELYSHGIAETGRIHLRYRPQIGLAKT